MAEQPPVMGSVASPQPIETSPTTSAVPDPTTPHMIGHMGRVAPHPATPKKPEPKKPHVTMGVMAAQGDPLASGL